MEEWFFLRVLASPTRLCVLSVSLVCVCGFVCVHAHVCVFTSMAPLLCATPPFLRLEMAHAGRPSPRARSVRFSPPSQPCHAAGAPVSARRASVVSVSRCVFSAAGGVAGTRGGPWTRCSRCLFYGGFEFQCKIPRGKTLLTSEESFFSR